jgi:hypothetical protein
MENEFSQNEKFYFAEMENLDFQGKYTIEK